MRFGKLALIVLAVAAPLAVVAQPAKKLPKIGYAVAGEVGCKPSARDESFYREFRDLGYVIGANIEIDRRCYANSDELRKVLGSFVAAKVDVIQVGAPGPAIMARGLTREIGRAHV